MYVILVTGIEMGPTPSVYFMCDDLIREMILDGVPDSLYIKR